MLGLHDTSLATTSCFSGLEGIQTILEGIIWNPRHVMRTILVHAEIFTLRWTRGAIFATDV